MTDKEFLQTFYNKLLNAPNNPEYCTFIEIERLRLVIENMPDKEKLLEETLKRVDKLCEQRNVSTFAEGTSYKADELAKANYYSRQASRPVMFNSLLQMLQQVAQVLGVMLIVFCMFLAGIFFMFISLAGFTWLCISYIVSDIIFNKEK